LAVVEQQRFPSPLRYPGGKGKLANFLKLLFLENDLLGCEYVEPYAGGASVALSLLFEDYASHIHINDLNPSIYAFWKVVLEDAESLCERIANVEITTEEWARQRAIQEEANPPDLELAFSTFFLNRTSHSGIIGGGIIGGRRQTGKWKIDARFGREDLIRRIRKIARHRRRITVTCVDAAHFLKDDLPRIDNPFVYLDPPYFVKGAELYQSSYSPEDHKAIAALVNGLAVPWIVSYDAVEEIEILYQPAPQRRYDLSYSAGARYSGREVMFFSDLLRVPDLASPAIVPSQTVDAVRALRASR
jgi:DNA adenine methylase